MAIAGSVKTGDSLYLNGELMVVVHVYENERGNPRLVALKPARLGIETIKSLEVYRYESYL